MTDDKITALLADIWADHHIVFWHDTEAAFESHLAEMIPEATTIIRTDQEPLFEVKHRLEIADTTGRYLLYSTQPEPAHKDDWLLDIRLYSKTFRADLAAAQLDGLGLTNAALHAHLVYRAPFLKSKVRFTKLQRLVHPGDQERDLDLKMLAVCCDIDDADIDAIVMGVAQGFTNPADLTGSNPTWEQIEKLDLTAALWSFVTERYGYESKPQMNTDEHGSEEVPIRVHPCSSVAHQSNGGSLEDLLVRLLVTDWAASARDAESGSLPGGLRHLTLPKRHLWTHVAVLCSHWRNHAARRDRYAAISTAVAERLELVKQIESERWPEYLRTQSFEGIEQCIIQVLRDDLAGGFSREMLDRVAAGIEARRTGFWASRDPYRSIYAALEAARALLDLRRTYDSGFVAGDLDALAAAYTTDLYRFDQCYRHCMLAADQVEAAGIDILKPLRSVIESIYTDWYLARLAETWDGLLADAPWLSKGHLGSDSKLPQQWTFYNHQVAPLLKQNSRMRVVVVISDALRYEASQELALALNRESGLIADNGAMLGVLPSYTRLGMAALLPHRSLGYEATNGAVLVDGKPAEGLTGRNGVLAQREGMAVRAEELLQMKSADARAAVKDARVVYVYHDRIDAVGDKRATEGSTFAAVRDTISELAQLVRFILKNLNTTHVFVTADHGFLYQDAPVGANDKAAGDKPDGVVTEHKRFMLFPESSSAKADRPDVWVGSTAATAGTDPAQSLSFWIPKGANRFNLVGGARFIHGGAMPQEVLVPLLKVTAKRGADAESTQVRLVGVSLLSQVNRVVNSHQRFELLQSDPISEKIKPRSITVMIRDTDLDDKPISDSQTLRFDSDSENVNSLKKEVTLSIATGVSGKRSNCALVLTDADTGVEVGRYPLVIDISFAAEF
jgi:uncharacterized protein (TIGR02687 family)